MDAAIPTAWLVDKIRGWAADQILDSFKAKLDPLKQGLMNLEGLALDGDTKSDDDRMASTFEGARLWQLGDLAGAITQLIKAESSNQLAAVPRALLTLVYLERGHLNDQELAVVANWLKVLVSLNPYAAERWLPESMLSQLAAFLPKSSTIAQPLQTWTKDLSDQSVIWNIADKLGWPRPSLWKRADPWGPPRSVSAIAKASRCGRFVALEWQLADSLHHAPESALIVCEVATGAPKWGRLETGDSLVFTTYDHVVTRRKDGRYSLIDIDNGATALTISPRYFAKMIGEPCYDSPLFRKANWVATGRLAAFDAVTEYSTEGARGRGPQTHMPKPSKLREHADLFDPLGADMAAIRVENNWHHTHFQGSPNTFLNCVLDGGAAIQLTSSSGVSASS